MFDPGGLQGMKDIFAGREALDRLDLGAFDGRDGRDARADSLAIHANRARAALRDPATKFRSGQIELFSDGPEKRG